MGKNSSPPPAPDYAGAATAQGQANKDAAIASAMLSNPNINSPYGSQSVSYEQGAGGNWIPTVTQTLNPESQQIFDKQQQTRLGLADLSNTGTDIAKGVLGNAFSFGGPGVQTSLDTSGIAKMPVNAGTTAQDALLSRLEPAMARQRTSLETQLTNQGLRPGSEAWDNAMKDFSQQQTDARLQAAAQGIGIDMNANNQGFNQAVQSGQFGNTAQNQAMVQALQNRELPLQEITALMSGSQVQLPQFQGYQGQSVASAPVFAATQAGGQYNQGVYNAQSASADNFTKGLFSVGAAAAPVLMSDRRLKSNIERVGTHPLGIGIYEYDIFGSRQRGVMADEVETVRPEAVLTHPSGYKMVNYGALFPVEDLV